MAISPWAGKVDLEHFEVESGSGSHETFTTWAVWHTFFSVRDVLMCVLHLHPLGDAPISMLGNLSLVKKILEMYSLLFHTFWERKKPYHLWTYLSLAFTCKPPPATCFVGGMPLCPLSDDPLGPIGCLRRKFFRWSFGIIPVCLETKMKRPWIWSLGRV